MVTFGIFKQVCTNGLMICRAGGTLFRQRHSGITVSELKSGLSSGLKMIPQLTENAAEWIEAARKNKLPVCEQDEFIEMLRARADIIAFDSSRKIYEVLSSYAHTQ